MSTILKSIVGLAIISSTIGFAATPVKAESKAAQCNRFVQAMSVFKQQLRKGDDPRKSRIEKINHLLKNSEIAIKQLQGRQFSDAKLRGFQQAELNVFIKLHNIMSSGADAIDRGDSVADKNTSKQLVAVAAAGREVSKRADAYCNKP
jgi:hypothetical protein